MLRSLVRFGREDRRWRGRMAMATAITRRSYEILLPREEGPRSSSSRV